MSSFSSWGCILKDSFERGIVWSAKSHLKSIEDFNLEHRSWLTIPTNNHGGWKLAAHGSFSSHITTHRCHLPNFRAKIACGKRTSLQSSCLICSA